MPDVQPWNKRILQFQPSALVPREQCERHYLDVHGAWAMHEIRAMEDMLTYHTNLMLGQWDLLGGFRQAPDLWRFATMRSRSGGRSGFRPEIIDDLSRDHQNFLRELRSFEVEESIWLDRRSGQLSSDKYVLVLEKPVALSATSAGQALESVASHLALLLTDAYGARLLALNRVLQEAEYDAMREPGQRITGRRVDETRRLAYLEIYFDHQQWGEDFFSGNQVRKLLTESGFGPDEVTAYHALERAVHDKR